MAGDCEGAAGLTSVTLARARTRAAKDGWDARLVRSEVDARAVLDAGCYYDEASASRVVNFFGNVLRHADTSTGRIGPFKLLEWQDVNLIRPLFGWKRQDGTRRYRRAGVWVPKKNGKSTLAAGLELYFLTADNEPSAEIYSAANDRAQAGIIHGHAVDMVVRSPVLHKRIGKAGIIRSTKTIYDAKSGSVFRALSADAPTKEGLNIHALIVDEIHAMKNRVLWDTLIYGGASRRQPLMLSISTAGVYDIGSIGWEQYKYAKDIQTGVKDDDWSFFGLIYEADKDDDWTLPATWQKANPSYGRTVKIDSLAEECTEAKAEPRKQNSFRRYRLNQWVQQATRWIPLDKWDANHRHPVSRQELLGALAYGGLDIGAVSDITAFAMLCECQHEEGCWDVLPRFWVPEGSLADPYNTNAVLYQQWAEMGLLTITPGPSTNDSFVEQEIIQDAKDFNLKVVGIDQLFQGRSVQNNLIDEGVDTVTIGQGPRSQGPLMKEFERLWLAGKIHHGGHPILRWMADNVEVKQDGYGNLKITKPNSKNDPRKVDGIQAIVNALEPISRAVEVVTPEPMLMFLGGR
jgi:phage terminase large subunit-like protein